MSDLFRVAAAVALVAMGYAFAQLSLIAREPVPMPRTASLTRSASGAALNEALFSALQETDSLTRVGQTARVLATIPLERVDSVLATLERIALAPGDLEVGLAADWLARSDPAAALEWATSERYGHHAWVLSAVMRSWAQRDPQAAVQAFYGLRGALEQAATLASLTLGWEEGGHPGMVEFLLGLEQGALAQVVIESLVRRKLVRDGPEVTIRWAESLPPNRPEVVSNFKRNAMRRVAGALADSDPERAMEWTATFGEGPFGNGAYRHVAIRAARNDGVGTMNWLRSLPAGRQRDGAVQEAYRTWLGHDRNDALAWMAEEPDAAWLDPAHVVYAQMLISMEGHEVSLAWLEKVDQNRRKQLAAVRTGAAWYRKDPEKAKAWAEHPPEWVSDKTALTIRDPEAARALHQRERAAKKAAYEARRDAASEATDDEDEES